MPVLQREHVSRRGLASDLGRAHLRVTGQMDLSGRTSWRRQSRRTACLGKNATISQICASSAWTKPLLEARRLRRRLCSVAPRQDEGGALEVVVEGDHERVGSRWNGMLRCVVPSRATRRRSIGEVRRSLNLRFAGGAPRRGSICEASTTSGSTAARPMSLDSSSSASSILRVPLRAARRGRVSERGPLRRAR